jgi:hypothetical protein
VQLTFLDLPWFFAIVAGEYQQQQLPNSRLCVETEAFCCCMSREYNTLSLLARLMLLALIVISVEKLVSL